MVTSKLSGKVVWITGSGRGIGKATSLLLAQKKARVVISARTPSDIDSVAESIHAEGHSAIAIQCDVRRKHDVESLVSQVKQKWGPIDILINNAGISIFKKIIDTKEEEWDAMMDANLKSAFLCTNAVLPTMIERQTGQIINLVSVAGQQPYYNCGGYCASKYGLLGFTDVLRLETRRHGIKVTALIPGATDTTIWGDVDVDHSLMIKPVDIARCIVDICESSESALIEKVVIRPQGGDL